MDNFEKVEKLREKANVSFEEAKAALEEANGDLLDAMIILEKQGKAEERKESYSTKDGNADLMVIDQPEKSTDRKRGNAFTDKVKALWHKSCENNFVVEHNDEVIVNIPIWVFIIVLLLTWHVTLIAMIVALFFGCRYSFKGVDQMKTANDVCEKVTEAAEKVKEGYNNL